MWKSNTLKECNEANLFIWRKVSGWLVVYSQQEWKFKSGLQKNEADKVVVEREKCQDSVGMSDRKIKCKPCLHWLLDTELKTH